MPAPLNFPLGNGSAGLTGAHIYSVMVLILSKMNVKPYGYPIHPHVTQGAELCFPSAICADQPFDYLTNRPLNYLTREYLA